MRLSIGTSVALAAAGAAAIFAAGWLHGNAGRALQIVPRAAAAGSVVPGPQAHGAMVLCRRDMVYGRIFCQVN